MAISGAERTRKSRLNRAISNFSDHYLDGKTTVTIQDYIEAKEYEFCVKHSVGDVQFDQGLINDFFREVEMLPEMDDGFYAVGDMFSIWRELDK